MRQLLLILAVIFLSPQARAVAETPAAKVTFQDAVLPILREHCCACHSQDDASAGLALDDYGATLMGGAGGEVLAAGDPEGSRLWRLVTHAEEPRMPPGDKLPEDQLAVLKQWIEGGLLDTAASKPKKSKRSAIAAVQITEGNRPAGKPAMPAGWFRQPVIVADRVGPVTSLAASPWAPVVAVPWQRQVSLYHTQTGALLGVLPYPDGAPNVVRFSRDGSLLLVAGGTNAKGGSAAVFDVKTGARLVTVGDELDTVLAADISPDRSLVAIGGPKKKVRVYRTSDASLAYQIDKHTDWVTALAFSPDGRLLATADRAAGLFVWQAAAGNPRADLRGHKRHVTSVAWRADSRLVASASEDQEVRLWKPDGRRVRNFKAHDGGALSVAFARDGRLVTAGRDRRVVLWAVDGKQLKACGPLPGVATAAIFTADRKSIVASDSVGSVQRLACDTGKRLNELAANPPTLATRLSRAEARRDGLAPKAAAALDAAAGAADALADATATHAAYGDRLSAAQAAVADAQDRARDASESLAHARAERQQAAAGLGAAKQVREASEEALRVAEAGPAGSDPGAEPSPGAVVQSLTDAVKQAKIDQERLAKQLAEWVEAVGAAEGAASVAGAAQATAERTLAAVEGQRDGLPDLKAAENQARDTAAAAESSRAALAAAGKLVDSLHAEIQAYQSAGRRLADETGALLAARDRHAAETRARTDALDRARGEAEAEAAAARALAEQIAELRSRLKPRRAAAEQAKARAEELAAAAEAAKGQLARAEAAAEAAEARRTEFAKAEAARERYLDGRR